MSYTPRNRLTQYFAELKTRPERVTLTGYEEIFPGAGEMAIVRDCRQLGIIIRRHVLTGRFYLSVFDLEKCEVIASKTPATRSELILNARTMIPGFEFEDVEMVEDVSPVSNVNPLYLELSEMPGVELGQVHYSFGEKIVLDMAGVESINPCELIGQQLF
jgi:hypothetical protein